MPEHSNDDFTYEGENTVTINFPDNDSENADTAAAAAAMEEDIFSEAEERTEKDPGILDKGTISDAESFSDINDVHARSEGALIYDSSDSVSGHETFLDNAVTEDTTSSQPPEQSAGTGLESSFADENIIQETIPDDTVHTPSPEQTETSNDTISVPTDPAVFSGILPDPSQDGISFNDRTDHPQGISHSDSGVADASITDRTVFIEPDTDNLISGGNIGKPDIIIESNQSISTDSLSGNPEIISSSGNNHLSDTLSINVIDIKNFESVRIEPGTAYVVSGEGLDNPVLVYPDENGNIHTVDSFYSVDGVLISGPETDLYTLDPVTGKEMQPMENVIDDLDAQVMDKMELSFPEIREDLENTSFESQMDTGLTDDSTLQDDMEASYMLLSEPDTDNLAYIPEPDPATSDLQDSFMDIPDGQDMLNPQSIQDLSETPDYQDTFADQGNDFDALTNGIGYTNDFGYQDTVADTDSGISQVDFNF